MQRQSSHYRDKRDPLRGLNYISSHSKLSVTLYTDSVLFYRCHVKQVQVLEKGILVNSLLFSSLASLFRAFHDDYGV